MRFGTKISLCLVSAFILLNAFSVSAQIGNWNTNLSNVNGEGMPYSSAEEGMFNSENVADFVGKIILITPFLSVIFIIHMVLAGYEWMTAAGDAKKVEEAKKRITNAVIGLILFVSLYLLAFFIIKSLSIVTEYKIQE